MMVTQQRAILTGCSFFIVAVSWILYGATLSSAQIIPDQTLSLQERSQISGNPIFQIDGGSGRGANLFHSFAQFSLTNGQTAFFNNAPAIRNIITRVTGGRVSTIDGILRANGSANLFFINPSGIIFGANARLNLGGSFLATTANTIQFENQGVFSATNPTPPSLLTIDPSALLFNQLVAQPIVSRAIVGGGLQVPQGRSLSLVGGDVRLDGSRLIARGGHIEVGGLSAPGAIQLQTNGNIISLSYPNNTTFSQVTLANQSLIDVRGSTGGSITVNANNLHLSESRIWAGIGLRLGTPSSQAGDVILNVQDTFTMTQESQVRNDVAPGGFGNGGNLIISAGSFKATNVSQLLTATFGQGNAGDIWMNVRDATVFEASDIFSNVTTNGAGQGGDVRITTGSLFLSKGSQFVSTTRNRGDAGNIFIQAQDLVALDGISPEGDFVTGIFSSVNPGGIGQAGNIEIQTGSLVMTNGAQLAATTRNRGDAGDILIDARDRVLITGFGKTTEAVFSSGIYSNVGNRTAQTAIGQGGDIRISTRTLDLTDGGQIITGTLANGDAGQIQIRATDAVNLTGFNVGNGESSSIVSATAVPRQAGGDIFVETSTLRVANGAVIDARTVASGPGGDLVLNVNALELVDGGQLISTTESEGAAGKITVNARQHVSVLGTDSAFAQRPNPELAFALPVSSNSGIFVRSSNLGAAGDIEINTPKIRLDHQGQFIAESAAGNGGNIILNVRDLLLLRRGSLISTTAGTAQAGGDGGNITVNTPNGFIVAVLTENSDIRANAFTGKGGNINITAQGIFGLKLRPQDTPFSDITASSRFGLSGIVQINTPDVDPSRGTVQLPAGLVDVNSLIANSCIARQDTRQGSFVVSGTGGLPATPDDLATSTFSTHEWVAEAGQRDRAQQPLIDNREIREVDGVYHLATGEILLGRACR